MESRLSPHLEPRYCGSRRVSGTHWKNMQGAARVSLPRQRQPVPLFHEEFAQHPPLVCRPSPPQGGEITRRYGCANRQGLRKSANIAANDLPPCGG